ncbi:hypothetical protein ST47_g3672 [Ascochyta rabiei]|uniref:Uncharacterized protein n=1 Tax=Didymella rabiei TaxID=5454 RepID=A0A163H5Q1_DIDRA|nr:hypothetical protein ST47_g3672 [Ascochyta rabiei]
MHRRAVIALSIAFGLLFLIVMALVSRLLVHRHSKDNNRDIYTVDGDSGKSYQPSRTPSSWKQLFAPKRKGNNSKWVPTLSGIVKAGDEGLCSSALFTNPHGHPGEVSFEAICETFANELGPRSMTERSAYSGEMGRFLLSTKRSATSPKRVQSMSYRRTTTGRGDGAPLAKMKSFDMSAVERGLGRSLSIKRPAPTLVAMENGLVKQDSASTIQRTWVKDGRPAENYHGRMGVRLTSAELATLSVLLGSPVIRTASNTGTSTTLIEKGAFGITIRCDPIEDGRYQISLRQHKRSLSQLTSSGSGHSSLFAKHFACGSLPFQQDAKSTSSILITNESFEAVRSGVPLRIHKRSQQTPQTRFLSMLPSSRELTFHTVEVSTRSSPMTPLVQAIAMLPFVGGLTPLASAPLISTVRFVASDGLTPGRLLQRLEGLVDKVHRHSPQLDIFGPLHKPQNAGLLFRERERLGKVAAGTITEALVDKVARMRRYVTLLERLMALVSDMKPQDVLRVVQEATKHDIQRSYANAVDAQASALGSPSITPLPIVVDTHCPESDPRSKRHASNSSRPSACRSRRSSLDSNRQSITFPEHNLGKQVETLLKLGLPFSVDNIATVARLVLAAWTQSVETVAWDDDEAGFNVPDLNNLPGKMILV